MSAISREEELFCAALALPPGERAAYVARMAAGDERLHASVMRLLRAHDEAADFLEDSPALAMVTEAAAPQETVGSRIDRYKLLQKLGEGGCGVVYMVEQEQPMRRLA